MEVIFGALIHQSPLTMFYQWFEGWCVRFLLFFGFFFFSKCFLFHSLAPTGEVEF